MHRFVTPIRLQHTDAAGVIFYARLFDLAHLAFEDLLDQLDQPLPEDLGAAAVAYPIVHASADYHAPLRLGNRVAIEVGVRRVTRRSFHLDYRFLRADGTLAATVRTSHAAMAHSVREAAELPEDLAARRRELLASPTAEA